MRFYRTGLVAMGLLAAVCVIIILITPNIFLASKMDGEENKIIQRASVAGSWYPGDSQILNLTVHNFLGGNKVNVNGSVKVNGRVKALIVPHAGYSYSGRVAGAAFRQIEGQEYERIFLLGPSHRYPLEGLATLNATHYETPLGLIKISDVTRQLVGDGAKIFPEAFLQEHSLEAEIPFIQSAAAGSELVPLLVGNMQAEDLKNLLEKYVKGNDLVVVSADLSHFHDDSTARQLDNYTIDRIINLDDEGIFKAEIDAPWAVSSLLKLAKIEGWKPVLLDYSNSGEVTGDNSSVVGYAAIVFVEGQSIGEKGQPISTKDQQFLLDLSRNVLENYTKNGKINDMGDVQISSDLLKIKGCFVTLTKKGDLRGCIGHIDPQEELYRCVIDNTVNAASRDTRFSPVRKEELQDISIEISVLTKPERLEFESGEDLKNKLTKDDGVVLKQLWKESTYLPGVWSMIPGKEEFLSSLCLKGDMNPNCWNTTSTEVYTYRVFAFSEIG